MAEIIPAVLAEDFTDLKEKLGIYSGLARTVHIDVCDGIFVPYKCWPYGPNNNLEFEKIISEKEGLPFWETFDFEIHLMVKDPDYEIEKWIKAGASRIIVHVESNCDFESAFKKLDGMVEFGVALKFETPVSDLEKTKGNFNSIQCMSIKEIGSQGNQFTEEVFDKIKEIRSSYPDKKIGVDGGINRSNAESVIKAGVDRLVIGSALRDSDDVLNELKFFENL